MYTNILPNNIPHESLKLNNLTSYSSKTLIDNLQCHLSSITQLSCLTPLLSDPIIHQQTSNKILNNHLYYYYKSKKADSHYLNQSFINSINTENKTLKETNDKLKELINEINWTTQEKIDSINEKEQIEQNLELFYQTQKTNQKQAIAPQLTLEEKKKKLREFKALLPKMNKTITQQKKIYEEIQSKYLRYSNENKILIEKYKQKQIIYDQIINDVNDYKLALTKHKKLMSLESKDSQTTASTNNSNKRHISKSILKKIFH